MRLSLVLKSAILLTFIVGAQASFQNLTCDGTVKEFKNYIRLLSDTDETDDISEEKTTCTLPTAEAMFNRKKDYSIQIGLRMTDTIKHDETENDYIQFDTGAGVIKIRSDTMEVTVNNEKNEKKICPVRVFENEQDHGFTPESVFYTRIQFYRRQMTILYAERGRNRWTVCLKTTIPTIVPRKLDIEAYSEYGINLDITHFRVDPKKSPWSDSEHQEKLKSVENRMEHTQQIEKLYKNVTRKEFKKLNSYVRFIWYYDVLLTFVVVAMGIKYKRDRSRKMHLL